MKRGIVLLVLALLIGISAGGFGYWWCTARIHHEVQHTHRELAWLELEFKLSPEQFSRISEIHRNFLPVCDGLCMQVSDVNERLSKLIASNRTETPEITALMDEASRIHNQSRQAVLKHLFEISAEMSPVQADRYLRIMMPQVLDRPYNTTDADATNP